MKIMILIPCMDMMHTAFVRSLLMLNTAGHKVSYKFQAGSLVYDSRNQLLDSARQMGVDAVLWLDSDMQMPSDTLQQLAKDIEDGCDIVCGLYFKRRDPYGPVIYKDLTVVQLPDGRIDPSAEEYNDYPDGSLFEVAGMGFGCVMMTIAAADKISENLGLMPFMPAAGFGEDLSFCMRAHHVGLKMWCDSRIKVGHIGQYTYTEEDFDAKQSKTRIEDNNGSI